MTDLDFTNIEGKSVTQEWILADSMAGTDLIKYPTKYKIIFSGDLTSRLLL